MKTDNWKEFRIGDLFNQVSKTFKTKTYRKLKVREDKFSIPALSSTTTNNGFGFYVKACDHDVITYTCLSVASNGDAGKIFVQTLPFAIAQDSYVLYLKNGIESENIYLFLATVMEKILISNYDDKAVWSKVQNDIIKLPAKGDEPDWAYMEEFIRNIKDKVIERYNNYRKDEIKKALESTGLTYEDLKVNLEVKPCDRYEKFKALDFFDDLSFQRDIANNEIFDCGKTPVYSATTSNYGLLGFVNSEARYNITEDNPYYIIFGDHTKKFNFVYNSFSTTDNCKVLIPKYGSKAFNLYILTVWDKMIPNLGYSRHWSKAKNLELTLPAIDEDNPDFAYMENVIYIYILKRLLKIGTYLEKKL